MSIQSSVNIAQFLDLLPDFEKRFKAAPDRYASLRIDRHHAVINWDWYTFHHFHLDPTFFVCDEFLVPGRKLKRDPKILAGKTRYGVDSAGRVLVGETFDEFPGRCEEEFREYGENWIDSTLYSRHSLKECINVARLFLKNGRAHACVTSAAAGFSVMCYEWVGDRIRHAEECRPGFSRDPNVHLLELVDYNIE